MLRVLKKLSNLVLGFFFLVSQRILDRVGRQVDNTFGASVFSIEPRPLGSARFGRSLGVGPNAFFTKLAAVSQLYNAATSPSGKLPKLTDDVRPLMTVDFASF